MSPSKLLHAASCSGDLPLDVLYDVLLRVPVKDLCRLRAVCRAWRALTSDPLFAAAHKSRHKAPLLALAYYDYKKGDLVDIVDLTGNVLRRISSIQNDIGVLSTHPDLICFSREHKYMSLWILNPATGANFTLPQCYSEELLLELQTERFDYMEACAFGRIFSTGDYKVLRVTRIGGEHGRQICEVITLDGTKNGRWRGKRSPPLPIGSSKQLKCVVVEGVVYFLIDFRAALQISGAVTVEPGSIALFNLETEDWMGTLQGPAPVLKFIQDSDKYGYMDLHMQLSLAELNGCLVTVHNVHYSFMDLWFLTDIQNSVWVKKYSVPSQVAWPIVNPLLVLDDGRILFMNGSKFLKGYDPRTGTYADALEVRSFRSIALYIGNLLSL